MTFVNSKSATFSIQFSTVLKISIASITLLTVGCSPNSISTHNADTVTAQTTIADEKPIASDNSATIQLAEPENVAVSQISSLARVTSNTSVAFIDLISAPNDAPLTIYGPNVNGPLIVGGVEMSNCPIINETVYTVPQTGTRLAKTTCWLSGLPTGQTTVSAGNSEVLPFRVNTGRVSVAESFAQFDSAIGDVEPGDVVLLKGFTTSLADDGRINGGKSTLWMRPGEDEGTTEMPIALVGYPGDPAKFLIDRLSYGGDDAIKLQNNGWVIANLDFDTVWSSIVARGDHRIVGNRVRGMAGPQVNTGTASIVGGGGGKGGVILGNIITGGASNWRFDHAVYITDCPDERGWVVDWNYIYDNDFAVGPQVVINHQSPRCGTGSENKSVASHYIRNNTIDTSLYRGRCIGQNSLGWDPSSNPVEPGLSYIENNDLINCGYHGAGTDSFGDQRQGAPIYISRGGAYIRNNRLYAAEQGILVGYFSTSDFQSAAVEFNQIDILEGEAINIDNDIANKVTLRANLIGAIPRTDPPDGGGGDICSP